MIVFVTHEETLTGAPIYLIDLKQSETTSKTVLVDFSKMKDYKLEALKLASANAEEYCSRYPDLAHLHGDERLKHYINHGQKEGRTLNFDKSVHFVCNTIAVWKFANALADYNLPFAWVLHEWPNQHHNWVAQQAQGAFGKALLVFPCVSAQRAWSSHVRTSLSIVSPYVRPHSILCHQLIAPVQSFPANKIIVAMVGTICKRKAQKQFISEVWDKMDTSSALLVVVGRASLEPESALPKRSNVIEVGETKTPVAYIARSDILVSYALEEVLPINIIEAMYCEKPIVARNVGGIAEQVKTGRNGFLVHDSKTCIDSLQTLFHHSALRKNMGLASRAAWRLQYSDINEYKSLMARIKTHAGL